MKNRIFILSVFLLVGLLSCTGNRPEIGYSGADISTDADITRNKQTKEATFVSKLPDKWELYGGPSVDSIDMSKPLLTGNRPGDFSIGVPNDRRYYFELVTPQGSAILAERHLPVQGGFNFRDLGGYRTTDNRYIKWGKIFRSDDLGTLTDADLNYLSSIPLVSVVDFRSPAEIQEASDKQPASLVNDFRYSITPGNLTTLMDLDSTKIEAAMIAMNELLVSDTASVRQYQKMFALLQDPSANTPLLYHCTAGKDRTGMATALILFALGMDEKDIMDDYLLSNKYIEAKFASYIKARPDLISLFSVKKEFLQAGIDRIKKDNGSVEDFLTKKLMVDIPKFRELYLY